jgi:hypothetical protein
MTVTRKEDKRNEATLDRGGEVSDILPLDGIRCRDSLTSCSRILWIPGTTAFPVGFVAVILYGAIVFKRRDDFSQ